jgi:8-oxo-dGTP pyrophosphatase MutT (NUDIX family)
MGERYKQKCAAGVFLLRKNGQTTEILFQKRGSQKWWPNAYDITIGHVEEGESFMQCAMREAKEEIGITFNARDIVFTTVVHAEKIGNGPYVNAYFFVDKFQGTPKILEPDKCTVLKWFDINDLSFAAVLSTKIAVENFKNKIFYAEYGWPE